MTLIGTVRIAIVWSCVKVITITYKNVQVKKLLQEKLRAECVITYDVVVNFFQGTSGMTEVPYNK